MPASPKILIVEDEQSLLELYKLRLQQAGYSVFVAGDGEAGVLMAKNSHPDLVLLDILMPKADGYDMLRELKSSPDMRDIPVIIFSNLSQKDEIEKGLKLGARDFIVKTSVTPGELVGRVDTDLKR